QRDPRVHGADRAGALHGPVEAVRDGEVMTDAERLFARVTLQVDVFLGRDEGTYFDPPEDYLVAREAEMTSVEFFEDPGIGILAEYGAADDLDADNAIIDAVKSALIPAQEEEGP